MERGNVLSTLTRQRLKVLAAKGEREDGRDPFQLRDIQVTTGIIGKAEGSADVRWGKSRVIGGIKIVPGTPYADRPDQGSMSTSAELNPIASPFFETGPPSKQSIELARVVDRGVRESGVIPFDKLCITAGEKVWVVFIDLHVIDYDGNLFDACSLAALAAILTAKLPFVQWGLGKKDTPLPTNPAPISVTFAKLGDMIVMDPSLNEDNGCDARLTIATDKDGAIRAMQKGGHGSFSGEEVRTMCDQARVAFKQLRKILDDSC